MSRLAWIIIEEKIKSEKKNYSVEFCLFLSPGGENGISLFISLNPYHIDTFRSLIYIEKQKIKKGKVINLLIVSGWISGTRTTSTSSWAAPWRTARTIATLSSTTFSSGKKK